MSEAPDFSGPARRGLMLVVSSPSGAGKTTLTRRLIAEEAEIELSISVTTRPRRPNEVDHQHYHFITGEAFARMQGAGELLESADVFGHRYGTPRAPVVSALDAGRDVLFDIDWQGTAQLKAAMPADVVSVFILPPSAGELMSRLVRRGEDSLEVIARRMAGAAREISHFAEYDFVIVNTDFDQAFASLCAILHAERVRRARQSGLAEHVARLARDLKGRLKG